jgi:hypothetical protein
MPKYSKDQGSFLIVSYGMVVFPTGTILPREIHYFLLIFPNMCQNDMHMSFAKWYDVPQKEFLFL